MFAAVFLLNGKFLLSVSNCISKKAVCSFIKTDGFLESFYFKNDELLLDVRSLLRWSQHILLFLLFPLWT